MLITTFDTYSYIKKLQAVGIPEKQAEAQVEILIEIIGDNLATKKDMLELETKFLTALEKTKADLIINMASIKAESEQYINSVNANLEKSLSMTKMELEKNILTTKVDIIKWISAMLVGQAAVISALIKLLQ
ncbi:putative DUF1640 domain-containing protein [Candidatus Magnetomoraceae bacterium gMMP-15]